MDGYTCIGKTFLNEKHYFPVNYRNEVCAMATDLVRLHIVSSFLT